MEKARWLIFNATIAALDGWLRLSLAASLKPPDPAPQPPPAVDVQVAPMGPNGSPRSCQ